MGGGLRYANRFCTMGIIPTFPPRAWSPRYCLHRKLSYVLTMLSR